ncbi:MAG: hypothetical protein Q7T55_07215 [Solirubrobacteraceae bacterium]|nr:hypothetical protein [Solirubrobacteraceae bacterium]
MNAFIRNKCEAELLAAFLYFTEQLGIAVTIESGAYEEGGLKEVLQFAFKPEHGYTNLMAALTLLIGSFIQVWNAPPKPNKELEAINLSIAKETLEEKRLANEKARRELQKAGSEPERIVAPAVPAKAPKPANASDTLNIGFMNELPMGLLVAAENRTINKKAMAYLSAEPRFSVRRSNFYKTLLPYEKVTDFGMGVRQGVTLPDEVVVTRRDFINYVLKTDKLEPVVVEEAVIHISAPVIDGSNVKWKGILDGESITFAMKDEAFKSMVGRREVSFQSGNAIRCRLLVDRKLDEVGEIEITNRTVEVVIEKLDATGNAIETSQGKQQRFFDKHAQDQQPLFDLNERSDT